MNLLRISLFLSLFLLKATLWAQQLEVTPSNTSPYTTENLISNIFLGSGVEIIDIKYKGVPLAAGYFQDAMNEIGIERGIFLSTGEAKIVTEPQSLASTSPTSLFTYEDNDLYNLLPPNPSLILLDIASYEITFIPKSDTLKFDYVFASEEYPEYVCDKFNDVFGFFISGPNPNGGSYNKKNIALIPGTNTPVTINNVNNGNPTASSCVPSNSQFYNDNTGSTKFVFDGYTDVFTAQAAVIPCQTYTIKIAIADVNDEVQDSGVFLKAKSFGTNALTLEALTAKADRTIVEGCSSADIVFKLPYVVDQDVSISFNLVGEAQNTVDISTIPTQVTIPKGSSNTHLTINALEDNLVEGTETLGFAIQINSCNKDTLWIQIKDYILDDVNLQDTIVICPNQSALLDATLNTPLQDDITFKNESNLIINPEKTPVLSSIDVTGIFPSLLSPEIIKEICIDSLSHPLIDQIDAFLIGPDGQFIELTTDNGGDGGNGVGTDYYLHTCFSPTATIPIDKNNPNGAPPSDVPFTGKFAPEGYFSDLWDGHFKTNGTWKLHLTDDTNIGLGTLHSWSITFNKAYSYQYHWTPDPTLSCLDCPNPIATPSQTTTYYFTVDDSYGCSYTDSVVVVVGGELPDFVVNCINTTNSEITFGWDNPGPDITKEINIDGQGWVLVTDDFYTVTGLSSGQTVNASVRFSNDCSNKTQLISCTTTSCPDITINEIEKIDPLCLNDANGSIKIAIVESGNYTYTLGLETNMTGVFTGLSDGNYTIFIKDDQNCSWKYDFTMTEPPMLEATITIEKPISCNGESDGILKCVLLNGNAPYSFLWSDGSKQQTITTGAGTSSVAVEDANGCTTSATIDFIEPDPIQLNIAVNDVKCNGGNTGSASAFITGGTEPFTYLWDNSTTQRDNINLSAGSTSLTVTDINGCTASATAFINEPGPLMATLSTEDATCSSTSDGKASVTITSGGVMPFSFEWSNTTSTSPSVEQLPYGDFQVTITDGNKCETTLDGTIDSPNALAYDLEITNIRCFDSQDGAIRVIPSGGIPDYTVKWDNATVNESLLGLGSGDYPFTITDASGCTQSNTVTLTAPPPIQIQILNTFFDCNDATSGIIEIQGTGGTGNLSYLWDNNETTPLINQLSSGNYGVTVTDENACQTSKVVTLTSANPMFIQKESEDVLCYGESNGMGSIQINGGLSPYQVMWDLGQNDLTIHDLSAGTYFVTITDSEGCTQMDSIVIQEPDLLHINPTIYQPICHNEKNGTINFDSQGGTPPYLYSLNNKDFISTPSFTNLQSGNYQCIIQDKNECLDTLTFEIINPPKIGVEIQADSILEYGQSTILETFLSNTIGNVKYKWLVDSIIPMPCRDCPNPEVSPIVSTTYHLEIKDEKGCTEEDYITIHVILDTDLFYPNAITPDGNGINDNFYIFGKNESVASIDEFMIFDRWGTMVFENKKLILNDSNSGWDARFKGKPVQSGVYTFALQVTFINGEQKLIEGDFSVLR